MKIQVKTFFAAGVLALAALGVRAASVGEQAPDFTLTDTYGNTHSLSASSGKFVVLEWFSHNCPFVGKHYDSGNMQALQKHYTGRGVVWYSINSTHSGHRDYREAQRSNELTAQKAASPSAVLLDASGEVGMLYGAKTTPHMFVVDPKGTLIYAGAIDDKKSTNKDDVKGASNYVAAALDQAMAGKPVSVARTPPYGCAVKYR
ncbi:MAG: thioredoxin family protein [Burkholderiales bacterium]